MTTVFMDIQDGQGYIDVTDYVLDDSLEITICNGNDTFTASQNTCNLTFVKCPPQLFVHMSSDICGDATAGATRCNYDGDTYEVLRLDNDLLIRVIDSDDSSYMFAGHAPALMARTYNGIADLTQISINATDSLDLLDGKVGDVVYRNYAIYNPANTAQSLIHQLGIIGGFTLAQFVTDVSILETVSVFAPPNEDDRVSDLMGTLLYEHGYTLCFDEQDRIKPTQWQHDTAEIPAFIWGETEIGDPLRVTESKIGKTGVRLKYYQIGRGVTDKADNNLLLYMDSNLPYDSDGYFQGYSIYPGDTYPVDTNVIDDLTGQPKIVYQEYDTASIKYFTNKAIVNKLDYNYKAFESDFSDIVATDSQWLDWRAQPGIDIDHIEFFNKKARIVFKNNGASSALLYFANIYGIIDYKTAEREIEVAITNDSDNYENYTCVFAFTELIATRLAQYKASQLQLRGQQYDFSTDGILRDTGELSVVVLEDGTLQRCITLTRTYSERDKKYSYKLKAVA